MAGAIFGQRGHAEVGPLRQRRLQQRAQKGVVDRDDRLAALALAERARQPHDQGDIDDGGGGIGRALDPDHRHRPRGGGALQGVPDRGLVEPVGEIEGVDAEPRQHVVNQVVGAAVEGPAVNKAVAGPNQGEQGRRDGRHAAVERRGVLGAVQGRQPGLDHRQIGMTQTAVDIGLRFAGQPQRALGLRAVEEGLVDILGLLGGAIDEGGGRIDRGFGGAVSRLRIIAVADRQGLQMQCDLVAHADAASSMNASARAQYQSTNRINSDSASGE